MIKLARLLRAAVSEEYQFVHCPMGESFTALTRPGISGTAFWVKEVSTGKVFRVTTTLEDLKNDTINP